MPVLGPAIVQRAGAFAAVAATALGNVAGPGGLAMVSLAAGSMSAATAPGIASLVVNPSTQYSAVASFQAAASPRTCSVSIEWYTSAGVLISTSTGTGVVDSTAMTVQASVTATSPSTAAYADVLVTVAATAAAGETHYVSQVGLFFGAWTTWGPGGFLGLGQAVVTRSDGLYVRGASILNPAPLEPSSNSTYVAEDAEAVPQVAYTYTSYLIITYGPNNVVVSPTSAPSNQVTLATTNWWFLDPTNLASATNPQPVSWNPQVTEQSTATLVMGQSVPLIVSNAMGGMDGQASFKTFDVPTFTALQALLQSQVPIFVQSPWGPHDSGYVRFGPMSGGMSTGYGNKVKDTQLNPSTAAAPYKVTNVTFVAQYRPAV